jgi:hypothetical protein
MWSNGQFPLPANTHPFNAVSQAGNAVTAEEFDGDPFAITVKVIKSGSVRLGKASIDHHPFVTSGFIATACHNIY